MLKPLPGCPPPHPPPPVHKGSAEETQSKGREETKKDGGTNRRADKSQRAERQCTASPWLCGRDELEFFYLEF